MKSDLSSKDSKKVHEHITKMASGDDNAYPAYSSGDLPESLVILLSGVVYGYSLGDCMWGIFPDFSQPLVA